MILPLFADKSKQLTYDKLVQARSLIFCLLGLIALIIGLCIDLYLQVYYIASIIAVMVAILALAAWLCLAGYHTLFKLFILSMLNGLLLLLSFAEGGKSFVFVYYFPFILIVPFILEENKKYYIELFFYVVLTAIFAILSVLLPPDYSLWENINAEGMNLLLLINVILSLLITVSITFGIIYSEKYFKDVLYREKGQAEKSNMLKGRFLSGTSHELRTSLNGITGTTHLLDLAYHLPEQEKHFNVLKYCADHMLNIVNEILDLDKIESGNFQLHNRIFKISQLITEASKPFTSKLLEKNIQYQIQIDPLLENTYIYSDEVRILQVLHNLLSNAVKFTDKGCIILKVEMIEKNNKKCVVNYSVEDTGIGILPEHTEKIFENFWQVYNEKTFANRGSGLGLALSKIIVEMMNGSLRVESKPGIGSRFYFNLETEIADKPDEITNTKNENGLALLSGKKVLIVEDDAICMMIVVKILEINQAKIFKSENGAEAINMLNENPEIDLVLMDLEMPVMNGYDAIVAIRKIYPFIPVAAFTATIIDKKIEQSLINIGFTHCISKPFEINAFSKIFYDIFYRR